MIRSTPWLVLILATAISLASTCPMSALAQTPLFSASRDVATGDVNAQPMSVATGDFNHDGVRDLVVANNGANTVAVLLGNGDGTFRPPLALAAGSGPASVAVSDLNGDGAQDVVVANFGSNTLTVLLGKGDGTFPTTSTVTVDTNPVSVAIGDFNGDGKPDLAVANFGSNTVTLLLGNGDGTFQAPLRFAVGSGPWSVAAGDVNNDGKLDLAVANAGSSTVSVLLGKGDGTFQAPTTVSTGNTPRSVAIADFNGDGKPDLAVANSGSGTISVWLGNGDGTFHAPLTPTIGVDSDPWSVAVGDFNGDGKPDVAVTNYGSDDVSILLGNGDGTFRAAPTPTIGVGNNPVAVAIDDFNGDGVRDLAVANYGSSVGTNTVSVLLGNGDGTFLAAPTYGVGTNPESVAIGDFNNDGKLDLAVANAGSNTVSVLLGNGDGTFQPAQTFPAGSAPVALAVGDFNRDGKLDLAVADYGCVPYGCTTLSNTVSVLFGDGTGHFGAPQPVTVGSGPNSVAVADFNGDGRPDLAVANWGNSAGTTISVLLGNGDGTFQPAQSYAAGLAPAFVTVDNFNGVPGLVVGNYCVNNCSPLSDTVSVLLGNGDGTFRTATNYRVGGGPWSVAVGDFNGDGVQDLAVVNYLADPGTISVLLGNRDGSFQPAQTFPAGTHPISVGVADFNGDGKLDLAVANYRSTTTSVLLGNGDGTFLTPQTFGAGAGPTFVAVADFNGDGLKDLAVPDYDYTTVSVLLANRRSTVTATPVLTPAGGTFTASVQVTLTDTTSGATIYYTTDGSTPTTASTPYSGPISVTKTTTINAMAAASGMANSSVASATYTILLPAATPTFSPAGGTYVGPLTVTLSDTTSGATIYYTTDGSTPTTASTPYSGPISVTKTTTINAMAAASGMANSSVASATYTIQVATPTLTPGSGTYTGPQTVTVSDATSGATIYYTTDGSTPTTASTPYSGPISVTKTTTINAMAAASGMANSSVASATYTLQAAAPTFSPPSGAYVLPQFVSISDASPGVTIYYTTDGSTPTTSSAQYSGPILVIATTTIKAIAVAPDWSQSPVASATYTNVLGL